MIEPPWLAVVGVVLVAFGLILAFVWFCDWFHDFSKNTELDEWSQGTVAVLGGLGCIVLGPFLSLGILYFIPASVVHLIRDHKSTKPARLPKARVIL